MDPGSLFQVLPLPEHICEFEVPQVVHEFAKKLKNKPPPFVHIRRSILFFYQNLFLYALCGLNMKYDMHILATG